MSDKKWHKRVTVATSFAILCQKMSPIDKNMHIQKYAHIWKIININAKVYIHKKYAVYIMHTQKIFKEIH